MLSKILASVSNYNYLNKIYASIAFLFSLTVYLCTMAPTTSFWDCGEFIATSYTLGVPHPPGTPLYLLIGNVFSTLFFFVDDVGARVNLISPIVSALAVMFLYLIIVELTNRFINTRSKTAIYASALIGSLLFAFTDSQWFNAVESEVYAMSTLFTAAVVWLAIKSSKSKNSTRYILLIAYLMGLAIGVHLLNLLAIPFIALLFYFDYTKDNFFHFLSDNILTYFFGLIIFTFLDIFGFENSLNLFLTLLSIICLISIKYTIQYDFSINSNIIKKYIVRISILPLSGFIFLIINNGIIKGFPTMLKYGFSSWDGLTNFEILNFIIFPLILIITIFIGLCFYVFTYYNNFYKFSKVINYKFYNLLKISIVSLLMIYIGFSTYTLIFIRAGQNPNINENDPSDRASFVKYMNREQYGVEHNNIDWYNSFKYLLSTDGKEYEYDSLTDRTLKKNIYIDSSFSGLDGSDNKQRWLSENYNNYLSEGNGQFDIKKVNNDDILNFITRYQFNEMYLRYFAWQFIGKEYEKKDYSWSRKDYHKNRIMPLQDNSNLANYDWFRYGLPFALIFGIIGFIYHFIKDPKRAFALLILFVATGLAIVMYLNQHDPQPRERDYSYVGSFFAFSIWVGIGCIALFDLLQTFLKKQFRDLNPKKIIMFYFATLILIMPLNYLYNDYHVHDRSGNYSARDYGFNILVGCKPNSVIFTNGDNDTFPLWYSQEVEENRQDVRVINLSLLNASWYVRQLYDNKAPGTIKFNFNEPILSQLEYESLDKEFKSLGLIGSLPIYINEDEDYYIDINNDRKYNRYNKKETLQIINNLEDPITATIYAYKRWDPIAWASIEFSYLYYELQNAIINKSSNLNNQNILQSLYGENYNLITQLITDRARELALSDSEDLLKYELMGNLQYIQNILDANQDGKIGTNEQNLSDLINDFITSGNGAFDENPGKSKWGLTPDIKLNSDENYPFYYLNVPPLKTTIDYINIVNKPTISEVVFRLQDIMVLKIIEDLIETDRSVYFATTVSPSSQMNLVDYFSNQGMILEITENSNQKNELENLYENLTTKYKFTNLNNSNVYYSPDTKRILQNYRILFLTLASMKSNEEDKKEVMSIMNEKMPDSIIGYEPNRPGVKFWAAENYLQANMTDDWIRIINELLEHENIDLILDLKISAHLMNIGVTNGKKEFIKKSQENLLPRLDEVDELIINTMNYNFNSESSVIEFYTSMINKFEIIEWLFELNELSRSQKMTQVLLRSHYRLNYPDEKEKIDTLFNSLDKKLALIDTKNTVPEELKILINDIIINEVINLKLPYQNDEYISNLINLLRDITIKSIILNSM